MKTTTLKIKVTFEENKTDPEALCDAFDKLLETSMVIPGILDEYGQIHASQFFIAED